MKEIINAYIGTYTSGESTGIYMLQMDGKTGSLLSARPAAEIRNPSYLTLSRDAKVLYSVMETDEYNGMPEGAVGAFSIDAAGRLSLMNIRPVQGRSPCHISTDQCNRHLFAANYKDGTVSVFALQADGSIGAITSVIRHSGSGPDRNRQEKAHAHFVSLTPDEKIVCAVDLGIDKIMLYRYNQDGILQPAAHPFVKLRPGSGPRHLAFHPNGRFVYVVNELSSDVAAFRYYAAEGIFEELQYISSLPSGYTGISYCAAIRVSKNGKNVYVSNRGHNSITTFHVNEESGKLEWVGCTPSGGDYPRDFAIESTGKFLLAANQNSDNIVPFILSEQTGKPEPIGDPITIPNPVCIRFYQTPL